MSEEAFDAMNRARIEQSLPESYLNAVLKMVVSSKPFPTPSTDLLGKFCFGDDVEFVKAEDAREVEVELREEIRSLKETIRDQEHHIMELERLRRYSPGPHMGQD